jgi:hypothetical protein
MGRQEPQEDHKKPRIGTMEGEKLYGLIHFKVGSN